jgi:hypothetical protein
MSFGNEGEYASTLSFLASLKLYSLWAILGSLDAGYVHSSSVTRWRRICAKNNKASTGSIIILNYDDHMYTSFC